MRMRERLQPLRFAALTFTTPELARAAEIDYALVRSWLSRDSARDLAERLLVPPKGKEFRRTFDLGQVVLFRLAGELRNHGVVMGEVPSILEECNATFTAESSDELFDHRFLALTNDGPGFSILQGIESMRRFVDECLLDVGSVPLVLPLDHYRWQVIECGLWNEAMRRRVTPAAVIDDPDGMTRKTRTEPRPLGSSLADFYVFQLQVADLFQSANVPEAAWDTVLDALQDVVTGSRQGPLVLQRESTKAEFEVVTAPSAKGAQRWDVPVEKAMDLYQIARARLLYKGFQLPQAFHLPTPPDPGQTSPKLEVARPKTISRNTDRPTTLPRKETVGRATTTRTAR